MGGGVQDVEISREDECLTSPWALVVEPQVDPTLSESGKLHQTDHVLGPQQLPGSPKQRG
uniref:Uncharacterized protein n=1 Tax=Aegilops tauschii TaxID=37682 RepID=R7W4H8_AEGTA